MKKNHVKKRLLSILLATIMLLTGTPLMVYAEDSVIETNPALANIMDIHPEKGELEGTIYGLDDWAKEYISLPASYTTALQIQLNNPANASYRITSGYDVITVSDTGLITPAITTWYAYRTGSGYVYKSTSPVSGMEFLGVTHEYEFGTATLQVTAGDLKYDMTIQVCDYADTYADEVIDTYIDENITEDMSVLETLQAICRLPASYEYSASHSGATSMIVAGGGDCWASTYLIIEVCERLGIEAKVRTANQDAGAGSGHMNALVKISDDEYYELEAGYYEPAPRSYTVTKRTSLFKYRYISGGIEVYQYDGLFEDVETLEIPETIDGKTVVSIGAEFICPVNPKEIILPNTLTKIGDSAFVSQSLLETIHIPASVTSIGEMVFFNCKSLVNFTCSEDNPAYTISNGILYNKDCTILYSAPNSSDGPIPGTVETIAPYAFYYNGKITELILPKSVKTLEEGAIAHCTSLKRIVSEGVETVGAFAFAEDYALEGVYFKGNAPTIDEYAFYRTTTSGFYPKNNDSWTGNLLNDYNGTVTWAKFDPDACLVHDWDEGTVINEKTCTKNGTMLYHCLNCEATKEEAILTTGHSMGKWTSVIDATYSNGGQNKRKCTACDYEEYQDTAPYDATWVEMNVVAADLFIGETITIGLTCKPVAPSEGDVTWTSVHEDVAIVDETGKVTAVGLGSTIISAVVGGLEASCEVCVYEDPNAPSDCIEHKWNQGEIIKSATCTEEGKIQYRCLVCPAIKIDPIPVTNNHKMTDWSILQEPTYTDNGVEIRTCTRCEYKEYRDTNPIAFPFEDVTQNDWFFSSVAYNYQAGLMTGMDATHFGPYGQLSRAQFALILYRMLPEHTVFDVHGTENQGMEGSPAVTSESKFSDVTGNEWYGQAVLWAAENGIVTGYQNGNFGPVDLVTREQMAIMMYRYANYLGADTSTSADISTFADAASVSPFAADGMKWAVGSGIITGKGNGTTLDPQGNTARCEAAAIIQRFMQ